MEGEKGDGFMSLPLYKRKLLSSAMMQKHHGFIPVIIINKQPATTPYFTKYKLLNSKKDSFGKFLNSIKKYQQPSSNLSYYFFIDGKLIKYKDNMGDIYDQYVSDDGFLYIYYLSENSFG